MDDNQSYANYLARLFGLIIALFLFGMAIWLVARLIQRGDDSENVAVSNEVIEADTQKTTTGELDVAKGESNDSDLIILSEESKDEVTDVVAVAAASTTASLPSSGPGLTFGSLAALSLLASSSWYFWRSRRALRAVRLN